MAGIFLVSMVSGIQPLSGQTPAGGGAVDSVSSPNLTETTDFIRSFLPSVWPALKSVEFQGCKATFHIVPIESAELGALRRRGEVSRAALRASKSKTSPAVRANLDTTLRLVTLSLLPYSETIDLREVDPYNVRRVDTLGTSRIRYEGTAHKRVVHRKWVPEAMNGVTWIPAGLPEARDSVWGQMLKTLPDGFDNLKGWSEAFYFDLWSSDREGAQRIQRAFANALRLCGAKISPF